MIKIQPFVVQTKKGQAIKYCREKNRSSQFMMKRKMVARK